MKIRVSSLPLVFRCAGSTLPVKVRVNTSGIEAANGTAAHEALRALPTVGVQWAAIDAIAAKHSANPVETRILVSQGVKLWNQVRESFRGAMTEVPLSLELTEHVTLTGHADLIAISQRAIRVGDYKTGRKDSDYHAQLVGYAALALLATDGIDEATATILWVRDQEVENWTLDRAAALAWLEELREVLAGRETLRPGTHCAYCPRNHECEAANALVRRDIAALVDTDLVPRAETALATMTASEQVALLRRADLVIRYAERVRAAIRGYVAEHGDVVADGVRLTIVPEERRQIDPLLAWPILERAGFTDHDFAAVMTLGASKIDAIIRERAGTGNGAGAVRALDQELRSAGALTTKTINKLAERRA